MHKFTFSSPYPGKSPEAKCIIYQHVPRKWKCKASPFFFILTLTLKSVTLYIVCNLCLACGVSIRVADEKINIPRQSFSISVSGAPFPPSGLARKTLLRMAESKRRPLVPTVNGGKLAVIRFHLSLIIVIVPSRNRIPTRSVEFCRNMP